MDLVFHLYKHVPGGANPLAGLANVGSTDPVCRADRKRREAGGSVSTDKPYAPRVMGASKHWAELVVQAHSAEATTTRFSMVRFGNVLGSSGSVVPLFRRQIAAGEPITLTHPDIIRYFMTIPGHVSAAVVCACPRRGCVPVNMGEPVRIKALAEQMVRLSGLSLRDAAHPDGDIEIVCTGLRPGGFTKSC